MLRAPVPARTPDIELLWQAASRISPLNMRADNYCWVCVCVWVFLHVCEQEDGELILEGLLNIYWGLRRPIRLQMYDDNERFGLNRYNNLTQTVAHRPDRWFYEKQAVNDGSVLTNWLSFAFINGDIMLRKKQTKKK